MKSFFRTIGFVCLVSFSLVSCNTKPIIQTLTPTTFAQQITPPVKARPSATATPTTIPTLTATQLSTLSYDEAVNRVRQLMETNNNCHYPCWWGIVPGKTTWLDANKFLFPFSTQMKSKVAINHPLFTINSIEVPEPEDQSGSYGVGFWVDQEGTIQIIETYNILSLEKLLHGTGKPSEIYIEFTPTLVPDLTAYHYSLALYFNSGITVNFNGGNNFQGDSILLCKKDIEKSFGTSIWLWPPNKYNFEEIGGFGIIPPLVNNPFKNVDELSGMSIDKLYSMLIGTDTNKCVDFPNSDWK
jgi:hypothetical protein